MNENSLHKKVEQKQISGWSLVLLNGVNFTPDDVGSTAIIAVVVENKVSMQTLHCINLKFCDYSTQSLQMLVIHEQCYALDLNQRQNQPL